MIPRALGGRDVTLTCKSCNSRHGTETDAHWAAQLRTSEAFSGAGTIESTFEVLGHRVRADFSLRSGTKEDPMTFRIRQSNPKTLSAIDEAMRSGQAREIGIKLSYGYINNRFRLAIVKAAYLALFSHFGYQYVLSDAVRSFWTKLSGAGFDDLDILLKGLTPSLTAGTAELPTPVTIVPVGRLAYLVVLKPTPNGQYFGALLPTATGETEGVFERLRSISSSLSGRQMIVNL